MRVREPRSRYSVATKHCRLQGTKVEGGLCQAIRSLTVVVMNLITVEEGRPATPFSGKQPPRSLNEFFADVLDKDLLDGYFSNGRLSDVRQRNLIGTNLASLHVKANERMKRDGLMLEQDNYSPHEASSVKVCRPPFEALHIMSAPSSTVS